MADENHGQLDLSIIIPTYNRADLVSQAMNSIHASVTEAIDYEILLVDDGSCEEQAQQLSLLAQSQINCRYIRLKENAGPQVARNTGMDAATGQFVKFLDSDDVLLPGALRDEFADIQASNADVLVSGWVRSPLAGDLSGTSGTMIFPPVYAGNPYDAILDRFGAPVSAILYRRQFVDDVRWDEALTHPDDWFFLVKVLLKKPNVHVRSHPVFIWRDHHGPRQSGISMIDYARSRFKILDYLYNAMKQSGVLNTSRKNALANYLYRDIYIAQRYDPSHYARLVWRIKELAPDFRPTSDVERNFIMRLTGYRVSYRLYVPFHNLLSRLYRSWRK